MLHALRTSEDRPEGQAYILYYMYGFALDMYVAFFRCDDHVTIVRAGSIFAISLPSLFDKTKGMAGRKISDDNTDGVFITGMFAL
ncbi:unnamed protein product [Acanthoscelides obtectus]|uniref:Uncharacterized protein n=1 Tax=Acanthoscelides obtectus TaxID=200917 RepID=A0A9P0KBA7_ACAOB|nr:unnamed protein product [Acanthoscelides obtectus]CAK1662287.1 hypothetical protein AOBTE_LOCUS23071 [Acanthoscelides obtectus]